MAKLSAQERDLRKPNCELAMMELLSSHWVKRDCSNLSMSFRRQGAREIGRNLAGEDLGMKNITKLCHWSGKRPRERRVLKVSRMRSRIGSGSLEIMKKSILSMLGADLVLLLEMAAWSSWTEKGDSRWGATWKSLGKEGNEHEGGQKVGMSSVRCLCGSVLLGRKEGLLRFLWRKLLIFDQILADGVRKSIEFREFNPRFLFVLFKGFFG